MLSSSAWLLLGLSALAAASPRSERRATTVTAADLAKFNLLSEYAASSYCNINSPGLLTCTASACPEVEAAKAVSTIEFADAITDQGGLVATDSVNKLIVVSFRGSSSVRNFISDVLFLGSDCSFRSGCKAHSGFLVSWASVRTRVFAAVKAAVAANPTYKIVTTGHSLGGAVATLAGADLRASGYPCDIYTFGSPRVGNDVFANFVTAQAGKEFRVTHLDDPVPRLPPILFGYRHTSPEYWLSTGTATTVDYSLAQIKVCEGTANVECNAGQGGFDTTAHGYYLGHISACGGDLQFRDTAMEQRYANLIKYAALDVEYAHALNASGSA
ncbi:lipase [Phlyctema vagabunda]|uniref:Lipase n=1 Tax=Phlyctema vagabunda TaxID=108571 RepID=A0ABR4PSY3_9HELO